MASRQSLKALAEERGYVGVRSVRDDWGEGEGHNWHIWVDVACGESSASIDVSAPTRRAAEAGLRACLEAMPLKRKGRG